jgi:hypothetical protein
VPHGHKGQSTPELVVENIAKNPEEDVLEDASNKVVGIFLFWQIKFLI